jgi:hypothetical protein
MNIEEVKKTISERLAAFQDPNFSFEEEKHIYKYGDDIYESVTSYIKKFKVPFDRDYWSKRKASERGIDVSVVLNEWQEKSDNATDLGTRVHKWIEDFWSGNSEEAFEPEDDLFMERVEKFKELYNQRLKKLIPLSSELRIFCKKWKLAGTVDQPFLMWDEKLNKVLFLIGDWKTNREFRSDDHPKGKFKKLLHPFYDYWEHHLNEYSIQVSLYRLMLEEEIGLETHGGFLVHIGPEGPAKIYPIKDLRAPLRKYIKNNRE